MPDGDDAGLAVVSPQIWNVESNTGEYLGGLLEA
jgi:hypothetical protein